MIDNNIINILSVHFRVVEKEEVDKIVSMHHNRSNES